MRLLLHEASWPLYLPLLRAAVRTEWDMATPDGDPGWLAREIGTADVLFNSVLPPALRPAARGLRALLFPGAGVIHRDPQDLPLGCVMCNVFEHETPIAEYVLTAILMHVTGVRGVAAAFREGRWVGTGRGAGEPHGEAMGRSVGLIGYGHIGRAIASRVEALGMSVRWVDRGAKPGDLDGLLAVSDFVVICCPLTPQTRGMIGPRQIALMRPDAVLINPARAEIVDEASLFEALRDRRIAGAALDVWYEYPADSRDVAHGSRYPFHELDNVLCTPHFSAWTHGLLERRAARIAANLDRIVRGETPDNIVLTGAWTGGA